jgi:integrase
MRINFYIDRKEATVSALMVDVALSGKRLRYSSGISLEPKYWNHDAQEVRAACPRHLAYNKMLHAIRNEIQSAFHSMDFGSGGKIIDNHQIERFSQRIKHFLSDGLSATVPAFSHSFTTFIDTYTVGYGKGQITNKRPADSTLQRYRLVLQRIEEYASIRRIRLTYESINEDFYRGFVTWLSTERNITDASIGNYIKVIKTFMEWSKRRGWHNNTSYEHFYKPDPMGRGIALSLRELRLLRDVDLTHSPKLARVRDHFLLQTFTGLRYSDLQLLGPSNFDEMNGFILVSTVKNDVRPVIPIIPPLADVLSRFPSRIFEFNSDVKANKYLKELGMVAGLTSPVLVSSQRNGVTYTESFPKYTQLTTHVARRTFTTISLELGLSEVIIRQVTGHKANDVMSKHYAKPDPGVVRDLMCRAWAAF